MEGDKSDNGERWVAYIEFTTYESRIPSEHDGTLKGPKSNEYFVRKNGFKHLALEHKLVSRICNLRS